MFERSRSRPKNIDAKLSALRSDMNALKNDIKNLASDGGDIVNDRSRAAIRVAENVAERAYRLAEETATDLAGDVESWASENVGAVRESARSSPFSAMFLSLGLGFLLGGIFLRR